MNQRKLIEDLSWADKVFCVNNLQWAAIFVAGIQAGQNYALNIYAAPQIEKVQPRSKQIELYEEMYEKGKYEAMSSMALLSGLILWLYKKTNDKKLFYSLGLVWMKVPITFGLMKVKWNSEAERDAEQMDTFLKKWQQGHWLRIVTDVCAFAGIVCSVIYHKK